MTKQVFKQELLTRTKVVNRIVKVYNIDKPKVDWYKEARDYALYLSAMYGQPFEVCAGVIAALSPVKYWEQNMKEAEKLLSTGTAGHMKQFVDKAKAIVEGKEILSTLNGRKTKSFYLNIVGDKNVVTIDRHALSIALGRLNTHPSKVQAVTWVNFKNYENINR